MDERHDEDRVLEALHDACDVETSPLGPDGVYADGRIEPAMYLYTRVQRLAPRPFKKIAPRIAVAVCGLSLLTVFIRMMSGIETGWIAVLLRVGGAPFGLVVGVFFLYIGLHLMFERSVPDADGKRPGLGEGCLMRCLAAPSSLLLGVGIFWAFGILPLIDASGAWHPSNTELVEFEVSRSRKGNYSLSGTTREGESFYSVVDRGFYEHFRDVSAASLQLEYLPGSNVVLWAAPGGAEG